MTSAKEISETNSVSQNSEESLPCFQRIACLGGLYSNYLALESALQDIATRKVEKVFCLGDLGAFGPYPDRVFPLLKEHSVICLQGNYDDSIGNALDDCQCGYTDPRDNHFAQISYDYTLANTSNVNREFLRQLPQHFRLLMGEKQVLLCHGSPRRVNEFLWETTTSQAFLEYLCNSNECDVIVATHTGIKWHRELSNHKHFVNVGVLGRPENDGQTNVWYTIIDSSENDSSKIAASESESPNDNFSVEFVPVHYDFQRLAAEMKSERLPDEFVETVLNGWWTSCLEVLPGKERKQGKY